MTSDVLSVIGQDVELKWAGRTNGGEYYGPCPLCGTGHDRFRVWPNPARSNNVFFCRVCQHAGDLIKYIMLRDRVEYKEAKQILGITSTEPSKRIIYKPIPPVATELSKTKITPEEIQKYHIEGRDRALRYYCNYGLYPSTIDEFLLGYIQHGQNYTGYTIPRFYWDTPVGVKIRRDVPNADPKYTALSTGLAGTGLAAGIFNTKHVTSPDGQHVGPHLPLLFVSEDEKSAMLLNQWWPACSYKFDSHWDSFLPVVFKNIGIVVWVAHNDEPDAKGIKQGDEQAHTFLKYLKRRSDAMIIKPTHYKDIADMAKAEGAEVVQTWIRERVPGI